MNMKKILVMFTTGLFIFSSCGKDNTNKLSQEETLEYVNQIIEYQNSEDYLVPNTFMLESLAEESKTLKIGSKETITGYKSTAKMIYSKEAHYIAYFVEGEQNGVRSTTEYYLYKDGRDFIVATVDDNEKEYIRDTYSMLSSDATISNFLENLLGNYEITIKGQDLLASVPVYFESYEEKNNTLEISVDGTTSSLYDVKKFDFIKDEEGQFKYDVEAIFDKEIDANATTKNSYVENMEITNYCMKSYEMIFKSENRNSTTSSIVVSKYAEQYSYDNFELIYPNLDEFTLAQ